MKSKKKDLTNNLEVLIIDHGIVPMNQSLSDRSVYLDWAICSAQQGTYQYKMKSKPFIKW